MLRIIIGWTILSLLALTGCEFDDSSESTQTQNNATAQGVVKLPAGSTLKASELKVITAVDEIQVGADGKFTVKLGSTASTQIEVVNAEGKLVMFGLTGPAGTEVSSQTTAEALLYFALGAFMLPPEQYEKIVELIHASPALANLAAVVEAQLANNPTALSDGDPIITNAIQVAQQAILNPSGITALKASPQARAKPQAVGDTTLTLIEPGADVSQSGVQLLQNIAGSGVIAQNSFRRWGALYAYETGTLSENGDKDIYTTPKFIVGPIDVPETQQLNLFNAVTDAVRGIAPWSPTQSAVVNLPQVAGSRQTYYDVVVLGPTLDLVNSPPLYLDPIYQPFVPGWKDKVAELAWGSFFTDFVGPTAGFLMFGRVASVKLDQSRTFIATFRAAADPVLSRAGIFLARDGFSAKFLLEILSAMGQGEVTLGETNKWIFDHAIQENKDLVADFEKSSARLKRLSRAAAVVAAVDLAMTALDIGAVIQDLQASRSAEKWAATVTTSRVKITPGDATVNRTSTGVLLKASVNGAPDGKFVYRWKTTRQHGNIFAINNDQEGPTYDTTDATTQYIVNVTLLIDGVLDTVEVEVFDDDGSGTIKPGQVAVGKGSVTVNGTTTTDGSFTTLPESRLESEFRNGPFNYLSKQVTSYRVFPKPGTNVEIKEYFDGQLRTHGIVRPRPISAAIAFPAKGGGTGGLSTTYFVREGVVVSFTVSGGLAQDYGDRLILQVHPVFWQPDFEDGTAALALLDSVTSRWRVEARAVSP